MIEPNLNAAAGSIHHHMVMQGFWESDNDGEKVALMHSELSEALEAMRSGNPPPE